MTSVRTRLACILPIALLLTPPTGHQGQPRRATLDTVLARMSTGYPTVHPAIVRSPPGQFDRMRTALRARAIAVRSELREVDAVTVDLAPRQLLALAADPSVLSISSDAPVEAHGALRAPKHDPASAKDVAIGVSNKRFVKTVQRFNTLRSTLGLDRTLLDGSGVGVAVIDSGIAWVPDFQNRIADFYDFTRGGIRTSPYDDYGHGTHVAGLIGGSGLLSRQRYRGVAPGVRFIGLKVLNADGLGRTSDVLAAMNFAIANRQALGIDIINLSLGHAVLESSATDPLVQAVEAAVRAGLVVVTAAGNLGENPATALPGYAGITSPGNAPSAITVGALSMNDTVTRLDDRVTDYSSRGPTWIDAFAKPDFIAPGDHLGAPGAPGTGVGEALWGQRRFKYVVLSGTSMASGVASGVAALVLQANRQANPYGPALSANAVKAILQYTSFKMADANGAEYDALTQGAGAVNGVGALTLAHAINTSAAFGTGWLTTGVQPTTTVAGQSLPWSQTVYWGRTRVDAVNPIDTHVAALGNNVVWGSKIVWGNAVVWGNTIDPRASASYAGNIVWGPNLVWSTNVVWGNLLVGTANGPAVMWGTVNALGKNIVWGNVAAQTLINVSSVTEGF